MSSRGIRLERRGWFIVERDGNRSDPRLESVYSSDFVDRINQHALCARSDYANELFLYFYIKSRELHTLALREGLAEYSFVASVVDKAIYEAVARELGSSVGSLRPLLLWLQLLIVLPGLILLIHFVVPALAVFLAAKWGRKSARRREGIDLSECQSVFLLRSKAAEQKLRHRYGEAEQALVVQDEVGCGDLGEFSIFHNLWSPKLPKIIWSAIGTVRRDCHLLFLDAREALGPTFGLAIFAHYWVRLPHKAIYEACLQDLLRSVNHDAKIYSADKEDRFALMQTRCSRAAGMEIMCIPHGLEYGFRFPAGLCGDTFYCFSDTARQTLGEIYSEQGKFIFSEQVLAEMLGIDMMESVEVDDRICFFTEPRDSEVNQIIIRWLYQAGVNFHVKLHPLEKQDTYLEEFPQLQILDDLAVALRSRICLARKSTVLLESAHRGRVAVSVLVNEKERVFAGKVFPSLRSSKIHRVNSCSELRDFLAEEIA